MNLCGSGEGKVAGICEYGNGLSVSVEQWEFIDQPRNCYVTMKYRVIRNDCRGFNNLSYTMHLR